MGMSFMILFPEHEFQFSLTLPTQRNLESLMNLKKGFRVSRRMRSYRSLTIKGRLKSVRSLTSPWMSPMVKMVFWFLSFIVVLLMQSIEVRLQLLGEIPKRFGLMITKIGLSLTKQDCLRAARVNRFISIELGSLSFKLFFD